MKKLLTALCGAALLLTPSAHADVWGGNGSGPVQNPNPNPNPSPQPMKYKHQGVFMVHYDLQRTGVQTNESTLTPQNVGPGSFGKLHAFPTDGYTLAQPLYVTSVNINYQNKPMDVIYVATENDTLYAFDAWGATTQPLWVNASGQRDGVHFASVLTPSNQPLNGMDTPATNDEGQIVGCPDIAPQSIAGVVTPMPAPGSPGTTIGITGTPTIDPNSETLFVVSVSKDTTKTPTVYHSRLHAVDINNGQERAGSPVEIVANHFSPQLNSQREGLVLTQDTDGHDTIIIGFSSNCDTGPYAGTLLTYKYDGSTFTQVGEWQSTSPLPAGTTINGQTGLGGAGIWSLGTGPAVDTDAAGNMSIFVAAGNGVFDCDPTDASNNMCENFGCSVVKVSDINGSLNRADYFTPPDEANMNTMQVDLDVSSSGLTLLPEQYDSSGNVAVDMTGNPLKLGVIAGKSGQVYLFDRNAMGGYHPGSFSTDGQKANAAGAAATPYVQSFNLNDQPYAQNGVYYSIVDQLFGTPAYFDGRIYFAPVGDFIRAYQLSGGKIVAPSGTPTGMMGPVDRTDWTFGWPGGTPVISANCGGIIKGCTSTSVTGEKSAILWFIDTSLGNSYAPQSTQATLFAYDATQMQYKPGGTNNGMLFNSDLSARNASGQPTSNPADVAGSAVKHVQPTIFNGHVYFGTRNEIEMYGLTGKEPIAAPTPLPVTLAVPTTGVNVTLNYDATKTEAKGCPATFVPATQYNFHIQLCGAPFPNCETSSSLSGGDISYLDEFQNIPVNNTTPAKAYEIALKPNSSYGSPGGQYEIIPGTNIITILGVVNTPALWIENPAPFIVGDSVQNITLDFYISCDGTE